MKFTLLAPCDDEGIRVNLKLMLKRHLPRVAFTLKSIVNPAGLRTGGFRALISEPQVNQQNDLLFSRMICCANLSLTLLPSFCLAGTPREL